MSTWILINGSRIRVPREVIAEGRVEEWLKDKQSKAKTLFPAKEDDDEGWGEDDDDEEDE